MELNIFNFDLKKIGYIKGSLFFASTWSAVCCDRATVDRAIELEPNFPVATFTSA